MQRSEDGCDMRKFRIFSHSTCNWCNTVLNLLEAIYLRLRRIVVHVQRVTVVKFGVDNIGTAAMVLAVLESVKDGCNRDLIGEGKTYTKNKNISMH